MAIVTKRGDNGETDIKGERVKKHHPKIEACGTVDELNTTIGIASGHVKNKSVNDILEHIQHDLFTLQSDISGYEKKTTEEMLEFLDKSLEAIEASLPKQTEFTIPRGNLATTHLHNSRAVCRRAERTLTKLADYDESVNPNILRYLNRLSDILHLFARATADEEITVKYAENE